MNWIDANKQVPEQGQQVLVLGQDKLKLEAKVYTVGVYNHQAEYGSDLGWQLDANEIRYNFNVPQVEPLFWCAIEEPNT